MDRSKQMQREIADGSGVREDGNSLAAVFAEDVSQLAGDAAEQVAIAFALGDDVVDVAVDEGVVIVGVKLF